MRENNEKTLKIDKSIVAPKKFHNLISVLFFVDN